MIPIIYDLAEAARILGLAAASKKIGRRGPPDRRTGTQFDGALTEVGADPVGLGWL
jgi:hypothetical protein